MTILLDGVQRHLQEASSQEGQYKPSKISTSKEGTENGRSCVNKRQNKTRSATTTRNSLAWNEAASFYQHLRELSRRFDINRMKKAPRDTSKKGVSRESCEKENEMRPVEDEVLRSQKKPNRYPKSDAPRHDQEVIMMKGEEPSSNDYKECHTILDTGEATSK